MRKVDHDSRRLEVAEAAAKIIASEGMEGLTTRNLAKSMNCSIGVLSHYFNSKDEIVIAAFNWADSNIDARIQKVFEEHPGLDGFFPLIRAGLPLTPETDLQWRVRLNLYAYSLISDEILAQQKAKLNEFRRLMVALIEDLQTRNEIQPELNAEDITRIAFDLALGTAQTMLMMPYEEREQYSQTLFRLVESLRP